MSIKQSLDREHTKETVMSWHVLGRPQYLVTRYVTQPWSQPFDDIMKNSWTWS